MQALGVLAGEGAFFAFTDGDKWRAGIGDPTIMGWLTVLAYFATACLAWKASRGNFWRARIRAFWIGAALLLVFLGVNKQLDLQTAFTFMAKDFAKATGWYEDRRMVQGLFVAGMALGGLAGMGGLYWFYKDEWRRLWPALIGLSFLLTFIVIRAASFHHMDQFLNLRAAGLKMNWLLELGGIAALAWPAWKQAKTAPETGFVWVTGGGARGPTGRKARA